MRLSVFRTTSFAFASLASLFAAVPAGAQDDALTLTLLRTRGPGGTTLVDAVAEIVPARVTTASGCGYVVQITITRGDGGIVAEETWPRAVACPVAGDTTVRYVDTFTFGMARGVHTVEMAVMPGGEATRRIASRAAVEPLPQQTRVSDLYLAREVAWDTTGREWPVRKGGIGIAAEALVDIPMDRPLLSYYLELYARADTAAPGAGAVDAVIRRANSSRNLATFRLHQFDALTESRPVAGTISIAGLPEGEYELEVTLRAEGTPNVIREQAFRVRPSRPAAAPVAQAPAGAVQRYFAGLSDEELARFDPVVLWMTSAVARETFTSMDATGKRTFLAEFFSSAAPPGGATEGEPLRVFLTRAAEVEREFGPRDEGGRAGWRTDRGRLWIKYGTPADRIRRPFPVADTRPYEIWYYDVGAGYVYLFVDEGGFGDYRLLYSTDPTEPTVPGWSARAGVAAVEELDTYYGIQLPRQ